MSKGITKSGSINPIRDNRNVMNAIERELYNIGLDLVSISVDYMNRKDMNVDGTLRKSVAALIKKVRKGLQLEFGANTNYALYVEQGTRPHWPPHKPIKRWVQKKIDPPTDELDSIAFLVQQKIAKHGTKARPFLAVAIRALRDQIPGRIQNAIEDAINRES